MNNLAIVLGSQGKYEEVEGDALTDAAAEGENALHGASVNTWQYEQPRSCARQSREV
jgi:hypothetical protein